MKLSMETCFLQSKKQLKGTTVTDFYMLIKHYQQCLRKGLSRKTTKTTDTLKFTMISLKDCPIQIAYWIFLGKPKRHIHVYELQSMIKHPRIQMRDDGITSSTKSITVLRPCQAGQRESIDDLLGQEL